MANYSKTDLINDVAAQCNFTKTSVKEMLDAALDKIVAQTEAGTTVSLPGFGRFQVKDRAARTGRNPATGETIQIAASKALTFKASKTK